jgi:hypothetical protein
VADADFTPLEPGLFDWYRKRRIMWLGRRPVRLPFVATAEAGPPQLPEMRARAALAEIRAFLEGEEQASFDAIDAAIVARLDAAFVTNAWLARVDKACNTDRS